MQKNKVLILGVTASGKSKLAFDLAKSIGAEIVSIDSMKVYRRMDIGTAKPNSDARRQIKYHLIDVVEPSESFSVGRFLELAQAAIKQIQSKNKPLVAVGGTALYIKSLLYGLFDGPGADEQVREQLKEKAQAEGMTKLYHELEKIDPVAAQRIDPNDSKRIIRALEVYEITGKPISSFQKQWADNSNINKDWCIIGLRREKSIENERINARVKKMIEAGLVEEVKSLISEDKPLSKQASCAIGYAEIIEHLNGNLSLEDAVELIKKNTRRLAKNQRTWFKTFRNVNWIDVELETPYEQILETVKRIFNH